MWRALSHTSAECCHVSDLAEPWLFYEVPRIKSMKQKFCRSFLTVFFRLSRFSTKWVRNSRTRCFLVLFTSQNSGKLLHSRVKKRNNFKLWCKILLFYINFTKRLCCILYTTVLCQSMFSFTNVLKCFTYIMSTELFRSNNYLRVTCVFSFLSLLISLFPQTNL